MKLFICDQYKRDRPIGGKFAKNFFLEQYLTVGHSFKVLDLYIPPKEKKLDLKFYGNRFIQILKLMYFVSRANTCVVSSHWKMGLLICLLLGRTKTHIIIIGRKLLDDNSYIAKFIFFLSTYLYTEFENVTRFTSKKQFHEKLRFLPNIKSTKFAELNEEQIVRTEFSKLKILYIGSISHEKGYSDIVDLSRRLTKLKIEHQLDLFGPIAEDIPKHNTPNLHYCGLINLISEFEINLSRLHKYDFLFLPTQYKGEGMPGVLLDAIYAGLPILTKNTGQIGDFVTNSDIGSSYEKLNDDVISSFLNSISERRSDFQENMKSTKERLINTFEKNLRI